MKVHSLQGQEVLRGVTVVTVEKEHTEEKREEKKKWQWAVTDVNVTPRQPENPSDTTRARLTSAVVLGVTFPAADTEPPPLPAVAPPAVGVLATAGFAAVLDPGLFCKRTRITAELSTPDGGRQADIEVLEWRYHIIVAQQYNFTVWQHEDLLTSLSCIVLLILALPIQTHGPRNFWILINWHCFFFYFPFDCLLPHFCFWHLAP